MLWEAMDYNTTIFSVGNPSSVVQLVQKSIKGSMPANIARINRTKNLYIFQFAVVITVVCEEMISNMHCSKSGLGNISYQNANTISKKE